MSGTLDPQIDLDLKNSHFSQWFPLPYRVGCLIIMGIWGWGFNLQYLQFVKIDTPGLIRYNKHSPDSPLHQGVFRLASLVTGVYLLNITIFWRFTSMDPEAVRKWEILPASFFWFLLGVAFLPLNVLHKSGRFRFLRNLRRISIGGIDREFRFSDILLADVLTSYAKVLGDLWVVGCMFIGGLSATEKPDRRCGGAYVLPLIIALPYIIRLRQCLTEYHRNVGKSANERKPHLYNSLKYASAFPVIIFSSMQRSYDPEASHWIGETSRHRLWLLSVLINSMFSFYWDVARDWDLTLFNKYRSNPEHPFGLRQVMVFHTPEMYYGAIILDFMLRCTWSFKLSPHLDQFGDLEGGIFVLQLLEILRRWVWIFFRVETEWTRTESRLGGDILLSDYGHKDDDED